MPNLYATALECQGFAEAPESRSSTEWEILAEAASRAFDRAAEVADGFFSAAGGSTSTKTLRTKGEYILKLPPFVPGSLTTIVSADDDYDFPEDEDWRIEGLEAGKQFLIVDTAPINDGFPYLGTLPTAYPRRAWTNAEFDITVTARWGFEAIPADVKLAVIQKACAMSRTMEPATEFVSGTPNADKSTPIFDETARRYREMFSDRAVFA